MLPGSNISEGQAQRNKFDHGDDYVLTEGEPFSFNEKNKHLKNNIVGMKNSSKSKINQQRLSPMSTNRWAQNKKNEEGSTMLDSIVKKLEKISYSILQSQYGSSFTQNQSHWYWISQLKDQDSMDKVLHSYTSMLLSMIQVQEQQRFNSQPKFKPITLQKSERTKLKLILTQAQQIQVNKFKNKGLQTYVKKIEEECEKYKRQHNRIKQRNRILQNQLLKISLEFKHKRQLYITQITRLTQILHSSFMQVGKMFINISNHNSNFYPPGIHNKVDHKNINYPPQESQLSTYNRKNVKSASPMRKIENFYSRDQPKLPDFIKAPVKSVSQYENYLKPQSVNGIRKDPQGLILDQRTNRHFDAQSEPGKEQRRKSDQKPPIFMSSTFSLNKRNDNL